MKNKRWIGAVAIVCIVCIVLAIFVATKAGRSELIHVIVPAEAEIKQKDFLEDENKGLVARFVEPQVLVENEDICIRVLKLEPKDDFCAMLELVVENNLEEDLIVYTSLIQEDLIISREMASVHESPIYQKECKEEIFEDGIKIEENFVTNPESYPEFYFRKKEYFTESVNYKYKKVYDVNICYEEGEMNPEQLELVIQILYSSKIENIIKTQEIIRLFSNTEIEARKEEPTKYSMVTSFNDVNQEVINVGVAQYVLERNELLLRDETTEVEKIIYQPQKRGHYIRRYYVGDSSIYFLEEVPAEEIENPDSYKKYMRLCVMNRDGTNVEAVMDLIECDWFYIPALYIYGNVMYLYDLDFLNAYQLDEYGKPMDVILKDKSIYSNVSSTSLIIFDPVTEEHKFYGLPFWLNRFGYRIASSESGEVIIDKNGEWETITYTKDESKEKIGFYGTNLEVVSKNHLVFGIVGEENINEAYIYDLEKNMVEGILTLPNGNKNCKAISADEFGIFFTKSVENGATNQQIYYYDFETKSVIESK